MIVECSNCHSTFNLPDELVPEGGRKVKCSVCDNVFQVKPEGADDADEPKASIAIGDDPGDGMDLSDDDLGSALDDAFGGDDDDASSDEAVEEEGELGFDLDHLPKKKKAVDKKKLIIAAAVLLVLLLAGGGVFLFAPGLIGMGGEKAPETAQTETAPADMTEQVKNIYLEGIRQYYVDNDKVGRIFVVEGKAVNQFDKAKELIEVEANLYDANNAVLDTVRLKCGNTLSLFQLQVLSKEEIQSALADEAGIGANNVNLQPGGQVPFMIVFFEPAESVSDFNVSVVAAQNVNL